MTSEEIKRFILESKIKMRLQKDYKKITKSFNITKNKEMMLKDVKKDFFIIHA